VSPAEVDPWYYPALSLPGILSTEENMTPNNGGETAVELRGVTRRFGQNVALDRIDFTMRRGEVVALLGPNGAGKTTLVRVALGLIRHQGGEVRLWGRAPTDADARRRVGVMLQVARVPEVLTVREHVHLFSSYYGTPVPRERVLDMAGVKPFAHRRFGELSGGQRQRALFALAVCGDPELLVLDEPTVGLDVEARREFWIGIGGMIDRGCAVLLTTHYLEEADLVADRVVMLKAGRVAADGTPAAVKAAVAGRRLRCVTSVPVEAIRAIPGVKTVTRDRDGVVALTNDAEVLARELLNRDPRLRNLDIVSAGLEDAFLTITGEADDAVSA
jgi:ABC-2 type transport system ATP-binding protein